MKSICALMVFHIICFVSCSKSDDSIILLGQSDKPGALVSYQKTGRLTVENIIKNGSNVGDISPYANHNVILYRVVYNTNHLGQLIEVSGLVMIPENVQNHLEIVQHHHGTIIPGDNDEVPSAYTGGYTDSNAESSFIGAVMASNGYVVSLPDYVGYGATRHLEHPYTVHHELAGVSIDMLRATKKLMNELSLDFSGNVFLTGWSEGGGAALATHKYLQLVDVDEFTIKGSSLLAGPYDYYTFFKQIIANGTLKNENLSIYSWATYSINLYSQELKRSRNDIWAYTVSNQLEALDVPSDRPIDIFQTDFINGIVNETDTKFTMALKANSLLNGWKPAGHLFLHSGTEDRIVPHYNSTNAHKHFSQLNGSSTLYEYQGGDHYTPLYKYVTTTINDFNAL
nr:lipase family protein [Allomuricauda sp.]